MRRLFFVKVVLSGSANVDLVGILPLALPADRGSLDERAEKPLPALFRAHHAAHGLCLGFPVKAVVKVINAAHADHLFPHEEVIAPMDAPGRWEAV